MYSIGSLSCRRVVVVDVGVAVVVVVVVIVVVILLAVAPHEISVIVFVAVGVVAAVVAADKEGILHRVILAFWERSAPKHRGK